LHVCGSFVMFDLEDEGAVAAHEAEVRATCELLAAVDARYLVVIDDVYTDLFTGAPRRPAQLDDIEWVRLIDAVVDLAGVGAEYGLTGVVHPHAQTHVETEPEIERLLSGLPPHIGLCLDVGHHAYAGGEPVGFLRKHHARIPYLHFKNVDRAVRARVAAAGT